ncbi:type VI secretion system protein TssL [Nostoc sp. 3335mG]|nr:type VI secretion system protein TssL [Nostoc sp. 3335mG]
MSGKDDPFGSGGKTVIRPMPGGGMPRPGGPSDDTWAPPPASVPRPGGQPGPSQPSWSPAAPYPPQEPTRIGGGSTDWTQTGQTQQRNLFPEYGAAPAAPTPPARGSIPLAVALSAPAGKPGISANPITSAAAPLLILLGRLRLLIIDMQARPLMDHVASQLEEFERNLTAAGIDAHDIRVAKYALAGTADDIVQNLPGTDRHVWLQFSMLARFFQVRTSGVGFFEELAKILQNPVNRYDLLELMHACLSLGFEGQYRGSQNGANDLARLRNEVYQTLRRVRSRQDDEISPRWRGIALRMRNMGSGLPLWIAGAAAAVLLLAAFFGFRILLGNDVDAAVGRLVALTPTTPITLERAVFEPAVIPDVRDQTQLERIRGKLADDIAGGEMSIESVGDVIMVNVSNALLFDSGKAEVREEFAPLAQRIAEALDVEPGTITVRGHTDNVPLSGTGRFKSNHDLSVARATAVGEALTPYLAAADRIVVEGKGELEPVADNATAEGRALNRRVQVMIPREETLEQQGAAL